MGDRELYGIVGPLFFRAADKFFKFVSWLIIIGLLKLAYDVTKVPALYVFIWISICVFTASLMTQAFYLLTREPSTLGIPASMSRVSTFFQIIIAFALLMAISSPHLYLDQIIDAIAAARR
jgi:hypothetical protein